jgi:hypothetical protein
MKFINSGILKKTPAGEPLPVSQPPRVVMTHDGLRSAGKRKVPNFLRQFNSADKTVVYIRDVQKTARKE